MENAQYKRAKEIEAELTELYKLRNMSQGVVENGIYPNGKIVFEVGGHVPNFDIKVPKEYRTPANTSTLEIIEKEATLFHEMIVMRCDKAINKLNKEFETL